MLRGLRFEVVDFQDRRNGRFVHRRSGETRVTHLNREWQRTTRYHNDGSITESLVGDYVPSARDDVGSKWPTVPERDVTCPSDPELETVDVLGPAHLKMSLTTSMGEHATRKGDMGEFFTRSLDDAIAWMETLRKTL